MEPKDITCGVTKTGTFDLISDEIRNLSKSSPEGFTISEMSAALGYSMPWCRAKLSGLVLAGKAYCAGRRTTALMDGRVGKYSPVYRLTDA